MTTSASAVLEGTVVKITGFGAFVQIEEGRVGLVHISEVANSYVRDVNEHVAVGEKVRVLVLGTDEGGRVNLSIRRANPQKTAQNGHGTGHGAGHGTGVGHVQSRKEPATFDDMLSRFLKDSEERQLDYKRATGRKGNGGYSRSRG